MLLEKAWAKCHGSYSRIINGRASHTLRDLTGAPAYSYNIKLTENIWNILEDANEKNYMMVTSNNSEDIEQNDLFRSMGLESGHAYSVLDVYKDEINDE